MGREIITFDLPGLLTLDQVSNQTSVSWKRTLTKVRLSTLGIAPSGSDLKVKLRLAEVAQATEYTLPAGLKFAENNASVEIAADTLHDFIVTAHASAADLKVECEFEVAAALATNTTDVGLGTLGELKRYLLNAGIAAETTYDEALLALGRGVAGQIDRYCNRTFKRGASITEDFRGGTDLILLGRYPVESVASIGLKSTGESVFTTQTDIIDTVGLDSGILALVSELGTHRDQIRVTYTGGYWYDPTDDGTGTQPTDAALLPYDLKLAWLNQCLHVWSKRQNLGLDHAITDPQQKTTFTNLDLFPAVKTTLDQFRRLAL